MNLWQTDDNTELEPRERILKATFETVLENQISGTRLRAIAERAGIAQGHLHYYFASKDELLLELLSTVIEAFSQERSTLLADSDKSAAEKLQIFLDIKTEDILEGQTDYILFDFWVQGASNELIRQNIDLFYRPWRETINEIVQEGVRNGEFSTTHAKLIPSLLISIMDGAALQYLIDPDVFDLHEYFQAAQEIIFGCLSQ